MQDKSFLQAISDLQERLSSHVQESTYRMLMGHITATDATLDIQDESMRTVVTNELITGQIIALLALMKNLDIIDEAKYNEFTTYLQQVLVSQYLKVTTGHPLQ